MTAPALSIVLVASAVVVAAVAAARGTWSPCGLSMITAINPMAEHGRHHRYWLTVTWFVAGAVCGGLVLGAGAAMLGWFLRPLTAAPEPTAVVAVVCCLLSAANDAGLLPRRLPVHPRQVNEQWLARYRRWVYAAGFGLQIGVGFATYIMTAAVYLLVLLAALTGSTGVAVAVGALFGLVRGSAVLLGARADHPVRLRHLLRGLDRLEPWSRRAPIWAAAAAGGLVAVIGLGWVGGMIVGILVAFGTLRVGRRHPHRGTERGRRPHAVAKV